MRVLPLAFGLFAAALVQPAQALDIQFDYSLDTSGFFTAERRITLEQVASIFENNLSNTFAARNNVSFTLGDFTDELDAPIANTGVSVSNLSLPANTMRFYVNAGALGASVLGLAWVGTAMQGYGSLIFNSSMIQVADLLPEDAINITPAVVQPWKFDNDIRTFETPVPIQATATVPNFGPITLSIDQVDFATIAMHELGHAFGLEHSENGNDAMTPVYAGDGARVFFTSNDWTAMASQGWQVKSTSPDLNQVVTVVPEPGCMGLMFVGVGFVGFWRRRRS